jgi:hypothetical protein
MRVNVVFIRHADSPYIRPLSRLTHNPFPSIIAFTKNDPTHFISS